jgi:hypothetical protein
VNEVAPDFAQRAGEEGLAELIVNFRADEGLATSVSLAGCRPAAPGAMPIG